MDRACPNPALALAVAPQVKCVTVQLCVRRRQVSVQGRVGSAGHWFLRLRHCVAWVLGGASNTG